MQACLLLPTGNVPSAAKNNDDMNSPNRFCSKCGKEVAPEANFCPGCGAAIPKEAPPPPAAPHAPDLASLSGPCVLFRTNAGIYSVGAVGKVLGKALGKPLSDVTRQVNVSRGVLAEEMDAETVRRIVPELKALGVECLAVPRDRIVAFPETAQLRVGQFTQAGLKCEVVTWDGWELVERPWSAAALVSCTQLVTESAKVVDLGSGVLRWKEKVVTEVIRRALLDIFVRDPLRHIRIEEFMPGQSSGPETSPGHPIAFLRDVAKQALEAVPAANLNDGVGLLAEGAVGEQFNSVAFATRRDIDQYNLWLIELLEYGYAMPRG